MKNSKRSQIVLLIGLAISLLLSFFVPRMQTTGTGGYADFFRRHYTILSPIWDNRGEIGLGLMVVILCAILYYIVFSKKKLIAVLISAAALAADFSATILYVYLYRYYGDWAWTLERVLLNRYISDVLFYHMISNGIFLALLILFAALLIACIKTDKAEQQAQKEKRKLEKAERKARGNTGASDTAVSSESYCGLMKHTLLLVFTCGIWYLIWIYRMTKYTNAAEEEEYRNPTKKLLLCMFIPFYSIYWTYKTAQRVDKMAAAKGISSELTTLCPILAIFVAIVPPILLQDAMNKIVLAGDRSVSHQGEAAAKEDTADEIKKFKELLDCGAITQEEFDAKKKQLLGL